MFRDVFSKVLRWLVYWAAVAAMIFFIIMGFHGQHPAVTSSSNSTKPIAVISKKSTPAVAYKLKTTTKSKSKQQLATSNNPSTSEKLSTGSSKKQTNPAKSKTATKSVSSSSTKSAVSTSTSEQSSNSTSLTNTGPGSDALIAFAVASVIGTALHWRYTARKL
jgi:hypothetical protein